MRRVLVVLVTAVLGSGCTHNLTKLTDADLYARTTTASVGKIDAEGNQTAGYHGLAPTLLKQDAEGNWVNMPGPVGVLSAPVPGSEGQLAYIISPKDTKIASISYTPEPAPGQAAFVVMGIEANISEPLAQHVAAIQIALPVLQGMTKEEALATVEKWRIAGEMAPTVADILQAVIAALL